MWKYHEVITIPQGVLEDFQAIKDLEKGESGKLWSELLIAEHNHNPSEAEADEKLRKNIC